MKRQRIVLLNVLLLLVTGTVLAQSGGDYDLEWQVIAGSGEQFVSGGDYQIGFTLAQDTPPLISSGGDYQIVQGYWAGGGASAPPKAIADLTGSNTGSNCQLDWTPVTRDIYENTVSGVTYNIYRGANAPYFTPGGAPYDTASSPPYMDPDSSVIGDPNSSHYYVVTAVDRSGQESGISNRAGAFAFPVVPGTN
jgi:hypothetical protein